MAQRVIKVGTSLEARTAALFVQAAGKFDSNIYIEVDNKQANAKSIMGMFSLGILDGHTITLTADGKDEDNALNELERFFS